MTFDEWNEKHKDAKRYNIFGQEDHFSDAYHAWNAAVSQYENWYLIKYRYRAATPNMPAEIRETCITIQSTAKDVAEEARITLDAIMREKGLLGFLFTT